MNNYLHNEWLDDNLNFTINALPEWSKSYEGITPLEVTINPDVGAETALFIIDRTPFIEQLKKVRPFILNLKTGVSRTSHGLIAFLLFYVPNPSVPSQMFAGWDTYINPFEPNHLEMFRKLAYQTHWHLVLIGANDEIVDLQEFENTFKLEEVLRMIQSIPNSEKKGSFDLARKEFMQMNSVEDFV
jgi:hypothetical protein